jgi:hypothetical protein
MLLCWRHYAECRYAECPYRQCDADCRYVECHNAEMVVLSVVPPGAHYAECMLTFFMLIVAMLSVIILRGSTY